MKIKKKLCDGCLRMSVIWKNDKGKRYCQHCWSAHKNIIQSKPTAKQKRLPSRSHKRIKEEAEYSKKRVPFLEQHSRCQASLTGICTHYSTDVHHTKGGSERGISFLDQESWLAVCRACHQWIHEHPRQAREMGLLS